MHVLLNCYTCTYKQILTRLSRSVQLHSYISLQLIWLSFISAPSFCGAEESASSQICLKDRTRPASENTCVARWKSLKDCTVKVYSRKPLIIHVNFKLILLYIILIQAFKIIELQISTCIVDEEIKLVEINWYMYIKHCYLEYHGYVAVIWWSQNNYL
jgi:hypothetical protein